MLFTRRLLFIPYLFFVFLFPSLFTNKLRGRLGAAVYCAALRRPLFNVHELRDGAVAHPSTPFAAFSLKGLASSSSTPRAEFSSPPFSKANLRSCRFLSRQHFALCFNAPSPTHALFPPFPPRHARAPSFISSSSLFHRARLLFLAMQTRVFWSRVLESVPPPRWTRLVVDVGVEIKGNT